MLDKLIALFSDMSSSVHKRRVVNMIYLELHEVLDTISHSIFLCKLRNYGLDDGTVRRKWLDWQVLGAIIHSLRSGWWSVLTIIPWVWYWDWYCSMALNSVMNVDTECTLSKSVMGRQLTENSNISFWRDFNKFEDCFYRSLVSFNTENWKVLFDGLNCPMQTGKRLVERSVENGWDVTGDVRLYEPTACSHWE